MAPLAGRVDGNVTEQLATTQVERAQADPWGRALFALAVLALALAPMPTLYLRHGGGPALHPTEPVLLLAMLVWAVCFLRVRNTRDLPPLAHWLLVLATGIGVFVIGDQLLPATAEDKMVLMGVLKKTAQMIFYLLLAYPVFRTAFSSPARIRTAVIALLATTTLVVALAVVQRAALHTQFEPNPRQRIVFQQFTTRAYLSAQLPAHVGSTFATWSEHGYLPSRAAYAGFLALVLPFALALLVSERKRPGMVIWLTALLLGAAVSTLAGYVMPAVLAGLLATGYSLGRRIGVWTLGGVAAFLLITAAVGGFNRQEILYEPFQLRVSAQEAGFRYADGVRHLKKFWGEHQAALNVLRKYPLFGVGADGYQQMIGQSYDLLGKIDEQRSEPGTQNAYLLTAVSTGILGLAMLLLLYGRYLAMARHAVRAEAVTPWSAALLGAIIALLLLSLATHPWIRGTSVVLAAWLSMIGHCATQTGETRIISQEDNV